MQAIFIPKHIRDWQPPHMRGVPCRRCHWCTSGPHRISSLIQVLESPMRFHFCSESCMLLWQQNRHDYVEWLRQPAGVRAKILSEKRNEEESRRSGSGIRGVDHVEVSVRQSSELSSEGVSSKCGVSDGDRRA